MNISGKYGTATVFTDTNGVGGIAQILNRLDPTSSGGACAGLPYGSCILETEVQVGS